MPAVTLPADTPTIIHTWTKGSAESPVSVAVWTDDTDVYLAENSDDADATNGYPLDSQIAVTGTVGQVLWGYSTAGGEVRTLILGA